MSTFGGLMVEYPQIAIDRFLGPAVLRARAYFLSHSHADHMVGLDSSKFSQRLHLSKRIRLYCSEVTREFLLTDRRYVHLESSITSLPIEEPTTVALYNEINGEEEQVLVTLLAAGHCPGSVMFLFEGEAGNVLYTGDFRLAKGEAARMLPLHSGNRIKDIKSAYVDTTFCVPEAMYIPSREQSRDALLDLVEKQIQQSPTHMVRLACKAKYGYEYLFVEISKEFNLKVHVSPVVMAQYERVPDLAKHLTSDGRSTQVHACRYVDCSMQHATNVLVVVPSTMWFTSNARPSDVLKKVGHRYRLCFSFHSSFSEVRDFVGYIRPVNIYANVIPYNCTEEIINERLQDLRRAADKPQSVNQPSVYKPLGQLKKSVRASWRKTAVPHTNDENDDELAEMFNSSPPPVKKRKERSPQGKELCDGQAWENVHVSSESGDFLEGSTQESYLAMDDSDLSSGELDLYDSAPDQSQPVEDSQEGSKDLDNGLGEFVKSLRDYTPHNLRSDPVGSLQGAGLSEGGSEKQLQRESKRAEIDSWLRFLPDADTDKESKEGGGSETATPPPSGQQHSLTETEPADTHPRGDAGPPDSANCMETKHGSITELGSSQDESDKTDEYSIKNSQETPAPDGELMRRTKQSISVQLDGSRCKADQSDDRTSEACDKEDKMETITLVDLTDAQQKHGSGTLLDLVDNGAMELQKEVAQVCSDDCKTLKPDSVGLRSQESQVKPVVCSSRETMGQDSANTERHKNTNISHTAVYGTVIESKSHGTVVLSSQNSSAGSVVPLGTDDTLGTDDEAHLELSQGTSQSQDTFLPSSQGSVVSRSSSDFDVPCTPEGKGLRPERLEAVWVMIAKGESMPVMSCNKTIQLDQ
ncbi:protein artemis-like [Patiria miniata]|uniref:Protein artemis n=1 Tax=Patiria miniata TaxID=46514 RepID=A0A914ATJ5_PATMI|nr:protein artemis-like [Patiria miniata]